MKRGLVDGIEFPANPFVALSDFLIVLLLIMILAVMHQSVSSSRLLERMAVSQLQEQLLTECAGKESHHPADPVLSDACTKNELVQTYADGDLQRFQLSGSLLYEHGQTDTSSQRMRTVLTAFGKMLKRRQGPESSPETGAFKRIIVEGNADRSEGPESRVWDISLQRAKGAVTMLEQAGLHHTVIEASGRGGWNPAARINGEPTPAEQRRLNRRIDIVITYSGSRCLEYLKRTGQDPKR